MRREGWRKADPGRVPHGAPGKGTPPGWACSGRGEEQNVQWGEGAAAGRGHGGAGGPGSLGAAHRGLGLASSQACSVPAVGLGHAAARPTHAPGRPGPPTACLCARTSAGPAELTPRPSPPAGPARGSSWVKEVASPNRPHAWATDASAHSLKRGSLTDHVPFISLFKAEKGNSSGGIRPVFKFSLERLASGSPPSSHLAPGPQAVYSLISGCLRRLALWALPLLSPSASSESPRP